jgi:phosphoribosylformimino-5-aminoimidazole carboxamide ribotide isomerase
MLIYPAIDLRGGQCVRLLHGRFDKVTTYDDDPHARLAAFADDGATWAHVVDLDGARAGAPVQHALIGALARRHRIKVQAGGGVRTSDDVARLIDVGVARVVVGSMAVEQPQTVLAWIEWFGRERICVALDGERADGAFKLALKGWTQGSEIDLAQALAPFGVGTLAHVLVTDVSRDGALTGVNRELMAELVQARPDLDIQASGGVATLDDLRAVRAIGAAGAIVGRALYENRFTLAEAIDAG